MNKTYVWVGVAIVVVGAIGWFVYGGSMGRSLDGSTYTLSSYNGTAIPSGEGYTLAFSDGAIHAKFCNTMSGPYLLSGDVISAKLAATLMFCTTPADIMSLESTFGNLLDEGATLSRSGSTLTLTGGDATMVFVESH